MACNKNHSGVQSIMNTLPVDQGGKGRHKCAACAYELGYNAGNNLDEEINLGDLLNSLDESPYLPPIIFGIFSKVPLVSASVRQTKIS